MYRLASVACIILALAASTAAAQENRSLTFAWPAGAEAVVTVSSSTSASIMEQASSMEETLTYRLRTEAQGDELILRYSDYVVAGEPIEAIVADADLPELDRILSSVQADVRVGPDGEFLGVVDYEGTRASMEELVAPQRESMDAQGMGGSLDRFVDMALSEEAKADAAERQWNQMVGFWAGRTLAVGEPVRVSIERPFPLKTDFRPELETELRLIGPVDCPEGSGATRCVELTSSAAPDDEELRTLMDSFMADISEQAPGMSLTSMDLRMESTLVVDEATLRPLRLETTSDAALEWDERGFGAATMAGEETVVTVFDWS